MSLSLDNKKRINPQHIKTKTTLTIPKAIELERHSEQNFRIITPNKMAKNSINGNENKTPNEKKSGLKGLYGYKITNLIPTNNN